MQAIIDFIPLLLALIAYKQYDIYAATIVLMVTLPLIPLWQKLAGKPVSQIHVWSAGLVIVFGTATLVFRDPRFVMMKPTILYLGLALAFAGLKKVAGLNLAQKMFSSAFELQQKEWDVLANVWAVFFGGMAVLNFYVASQFTEAQWFQFKVWGLTGLTLVFIIAQSVWIATKAQDEAEQE
ncbi:MAG: inner membrane-spanning protein YciB [Pseudomonadota bacterium]